MKQMVRPLPLPSLANPVDSDTSPFTSAKVKYRGPSHLRHEISDLRKRERELEQKICEREEAASSGEKELWALSALISGAEWRKELAMEKDVALRRDIEYVEAQADQLQRIAQAEEWKSARACERCAWLRRQTAAIREKDRKTQSEIARLAEKESELYRKLEQYEWRESQAATSLDQAALQSIELKTVLGISQAGNGGGRLGNPRRRELERSAVQQVVGLRGAYQRIDAAHKSRQRLESEIEWKYDQLEYWQNEYSKVIDDLGKALSRSKLRVTVV